VPLDDHLDQLAVSDEERPDVRKVLEALSRLPLNQRGALVVREVEGRTYTEIADTLGVSVPAVETLIFRARRALRVQASSIRALAAVPLPSTLSQFLGEAGGIAAGGGAVIGSGFLLKAAVAIVAGVIASTVAGGRDQHGHRHGRIACSDGSRAAVLAGPRAVGPVGAVGDPPDADDPNVALSHPGAAQESGESGIY